MQYDPHATLHAEQVFEQSVMGVEEWPRERSWRDPGWGSVLHQLCGLGASQSTELQPPHFSPPHYDKSLEEQLWSYECLSLKSQQNVWLTCHFVSIQLIQSNHISLLTISDNLAFWGYWLTLEGRILTLVWIEILHSQNLMSLLDKLNIMKNAAGD